MQISVQVIVVG